jgi:hypothetical protein
MTKEEYEHMRHAIKVEHARTESKFSIEREKLKAKRVRLNVQLADVKQQLSDLSRKQVAEIAVYHERLSALLKEYEANKEVAPEATQP